MDNLKQAIEIMEKRWLYVNTAYDDEMMEVLAKMKAAFQERTKWAILLHDLADIVIETQEFQDPSDIDLADWAISLVHPYLVDHHCDSEQLLSDEDRRGAQEVSIKEQLE